MSHVERVKQWLARCSPAQREEIFRHLRHEFAIHPLETALHTKAEIILEAIHRAGGLTLRMMRGVIAEAAFEVEVVDRLKKWEKLPRVGDPPYDFHLTDGRGDVRVQVKLQRSKGGEPWLANVARKAFRSLPAAVYVVETWRTRGGKDKATGRATRPYRFGEFDLLAVCMSPVTKRWDVFMYTVANWLLPDPSNATEIFKYQPVAGTPNDDWTDDFVRAVRWFRSSRRKTIGTV